MIFKPLIVLIALLTIMMTSCHSKSDPLDDITQTDINGNILSTDKRDWSVHYNQADSLLGNNLITAPAYPNPTNSTIFFKYGFPDTMRVTITIEHSQVIIRTLYSNELQQAGYHLTSWDCKNDNVEIVSNGLYRLIMVFRHGDIEFTGYGDILVDR